MATIRDVFFPSFFCFSPIYCIKLKNIQTTLNHFERKSYIPETLAMVDTTICCNRLLNIQAAIKKDKKSYIVEVRLDLTVVYTSDIIMDLTKELKKHRRAYIPPNIPELRVDC